MRVISIAIIGFALLLAATVFFVVPRLMSERHTIAARAPARPIMSMVLVASRPLTAGTIVAPDDLAWQRWPNAALDPDFLVRKHGTNPAKHVIGRIVLHGLDKNEPIAMAMLLKPGTAGFLAAALRPGMRAVTIRIDAVSAAGGFILPGDHVDVLLTEHYAVAANAAPTRPNRPQIADKDVASVLLRDIKVLAIDQRMQDIDSKPKVGSTATLEVGVVAAEKLAIAAEMGTLSLALRSPAQIPHHAPRARLVEDIEVSPFRAQFAAREGRGFARTGSGSLHVYRGAVLARAAGP